MPKLFKYQKHITRDITRILNAPEDATELAELDGWTYVSLPDGEELPADQPEEIAHTITPVTLDDELREQIKSASPHVWLINKRVRDKIAEAYPLHEEIKLLRTAPSAEFEAYNAHAEACREWGRAQKALLGL